MKKKLPPTLVLILFLSLNPLFLFSQTPTDSIVQNLSSDPRVKEFQMDSLRGTPSLIRMNPAKDPLQTAQVPSFLADVLGFGPGTAFQIAHAVPNRGFTVQIFQQYTNGIKVEHGVFKAITKDDVVLALTAEYYNLSPEITSTPSLSEAAALDKALIYIGADTYAWEAVALLEDSPEKTAALEAISPKGELVFVDNYATPDIDISLAYKFNIYATEPLSRDDIYVDASTGDILLRDPIIKHANGMRTAREVVALNRAEADTRPSPSSAIVARGETRYAGSRNFDTSIDANGNYVLKGVTPSGVANETLSYGGIGGLPLSIPALASLATPIADGDGSLLHPETADNFWSQEEHRKDEFSTTQVYPIFNERNNDDIALDAHWGAEVVLDYWKNKHNRLSYDNKGTKIFNYVHYGDAYDNAFWNGTAMTYGDGSYQGGTNPNGTFAPLTSMDVCAHEIGHGVCEFTSNLVYQRESGAMNEGFSDIWAAAVEHFVLTEIDGSLNYDPFGIGEQIDQSDGGIAPGNPGSRALRWMDDPKAEGAPDSYGGVNWQEPNCGTPTLANDYCGVHTNSGVLNKWYYFLVSGSGQAFSPGYQKQSGDDQVTDAGNTYSVEGLGFEKASNITYMSEVMLSPNATFAEMREASILVAQMLYGIASPEEISTTNAWYAVDVGAAYNTGDPNTITFSDQNTQLLAENNELSACEDQNVYEILIQGTQVDPAATISISTAGSTAVPGEDFEISATEIGFVGTQRNFLSLTVLDDAEIEGSETIKLSFVFNGELQQQEYAISDNDFVPKTGSEPFELLSEEFSTSSFSAGWSTVQLGDGVNVWKSNGNLSAAGRAYITDGVANIPYYDQLSPSHTILRSPLLNAAGASQVTVSFDWEAGGETDAVDPSVIFDYGEFVYSFDGATYYSVQKFVGNGPLGTETASGQFQASMEELDGKSFFLGWRWFNDTNAGSQFSFAIDNLVVTAVPAGIETQAGEQAIAKVFQGNTIYFLSASDKALIARIQNASDDLGCVTLGVAEAGNGSVGFSGIATTRPSKVFSIITENPDATYDLTIYFTAEELADFEVPANLIPLKVNSQAIDDADEGSGNFRLDGVLTEHNSEDGYYAYTGTFSGSGTLSVVNDFAYCITPPKPWLSADIGEPAVPGEVCYTEGVFEVTAGGAGLTGKRDGFHFTYQKFSGDVELIAEVTGLEASGAGSKAAVMLRGSLQPDARFAMTSLEAGEDLSRPSAAFSFRKNAGGKTSTRSGGTSTLPQFIRIVRKGKDVHSYLSDGTGNWQLLGSTVVHLPQDLYVGLATTSGNTGSTAVARFEQVSVQGTGALTLKQSSQQEEELQNTQESSAMKVYPNPAVSVLHATVENHSIRSLSVYNLNGKLIKTAYFPTGDHKEQISVADLFQGIYLLKATTAAGAEFNARFVKD